jgi:hypothetical protein
LTNGRIAILLPSLGRRALFQRWYDSFLATSVTDKCDIFMWNVDDDPALHEYDDVPAHIIRHHGPRDHRWFGFVNCTNELYKLHPGYSYYMSAEDDVVMLEHGWDKRVLEFFQSLPVAGNVVKFEDNAHCIDSYIIDSAYTDAAGYFHYPIFPGYGCWAVREIAEEIGRYHLLNGPVLEHFVQTRDGFCAGSFDTMEPERREQALCEKYIHEKWIDKSRPECGLVLEAQRVKARLACPPQLP